MTFQCWACQCTVDGRLHRLSIVRLSDARSKEQRWFSERVCTRCAQRIVETLQVLAAEPSPRIA